MPSSRFFKLPDEKRSKILRAVHSELAEFPVDELSINRIIHSAGISRGSFYQYFKDKDDLLEYVFSDFRQVMTREIKASIERNQGDMFEVGMDILKKNSCDGQPGGKPQDFCQCVFVCQGCAEQPRKGDCR